MSPRRFRASRKAANCCSGGWAVGTLVALAATVPMSGPEQDFVLLTNHAVQWPFAFPWLLLVDDGGTLADAWVFAALGLANACLIYVIVLWASVRRSLRRASAPHWVPDGDS